MAWLAHGQQTASADMVLPTQKKRQHRSDHRAHGDDAGHRHPDHRSEPHRIRDRRVADSQPVLPENTKKADSPKNRPERQSGGQLAKRGHATNP